MGNSQAAQEKDVSEMMQEAEDKKTDSAFEVFKLEQQLKNVQRRLDVAVQNGRSSEAERLAREKVMLQQQIDKQQDTLERYNKAVMEAQSIQMASDLDNITGKLDRVANRGKTSAERMHRRSMKLQKNLQTVNEKTAESKELVDKALSNGLQYQTSAVKAAVKEEIDRSKQMEAIALREQAMQAESCSVQSSQTHMVAPRPSG